MSKSRDTIRIRQAMGEGIKTGALSTEDPLEDMEVATLIYGSEGRAFLGIKSESVPEFLKPVVLHQAPLASQPINPGDKPLHATNHECDIGGVCRAAFATGTSGQFALQSHEMMA